MIGERHRGRRRRAALSRLPGRRTNLLLAVGLLLVLATVTGLVLDPLSQDGGAPAHPGQRGIGAAPGGEPDGAQGPPRRAITPPTASPEPGPAPVAGFPNASNTGWRHTGVELTPYQGPEVIETPGTVIDGKDMGCIWIVVPDVTITRSRIRCDGYFPVRVDGAGSLTIEDTEIDGLGSPDGSCVTSQNYVARRVDCHGVGDGMYIAGNNVVIEDSYIHDLASCGGCHTDSIQATGGENILIRGNTIENAYEQTGVLKLGAEDGRLHDVLVEGNLLNGGGYTVYGGGTDGDVAGIRFVNNSFMRAPEGFFAQGGRWGPVAYFEPSLPGNEWRGNVWHDDGSPVEPAF